MSIFSNHVDFFSPPALNPGNEIHNRIIRHFIVCFIYFYPYGFCSASKNRERNFHNLNIIIRFSLIYIDAQHVLITNPTTSRTYSSRKQTPEKIRTIVIIKQKTTITSIRNSFEIIERKNNDWMYKKRWQWVIAGNLWHGHLSTLIFRKNERS